MKIYEKDHNKYLLRTPVINKYIWFDKFHCPSIRLNSISKIDSKKIHIMDSNISIFIYICMKGDNRLNILDYFPNIIYQDHMNTNTSYFMPYNKFRNISNMRIYSEPTIKWLYRYLYGLCHKISIFQNKFVNKELSLYFNSVSIRYY